MACGAAVSFDDLLGLGYSGYARIGDYYLRLLPSQVTETDNLTLPESSYGSESSQVNGQVPSIGRRALQLSLSTEFTPILGNFVNDAFIKWRTLYNEGAAPFDIEIVVARGEGYRSDDAYINGIRISNSPGNLTTCQIDIDCHVWEYIEASAQVQSNSIVPFDIFSLDYKPMPHWSSCASLTRLGGPCVDWTLSLKNNWQYTFLIEGNLSPTGPPNPRLVYPGPLDTELNLTVLAAPGERPPESSPGAVTLRVPYNGLLSPVMNLRYSTLVRHPSRSYQGFGSPNTPISWSTSYYALGATPVWSPS